MAEWLFWLGLLLAPFYNVLLFSPAGIEMSVVDVVFLVAFALWSLSLLMRGRFRANTALGLMILFLQFSLFSSLFSVEVLVALKRWGRTMMRFIVFVLMMPDLMSNTRRWRVYIHLFVISGVLFGVLNYIDLLVSPQTALKIFFENSEKAIHLRFIYPTVGRVGINYGHEIGHWQASAILLLLGLFLGSSTTRQRIGWAALALPCVATLMFSFTKSAWLGVAVGVFYMVYRLYISRALVIRENTLRIRKRPVRRALLLFLMVVISAAFFWFVVFPPTARRLVILAFTFHDVSSSGRLRLWQGLVPIVLDNWLLGVGWVNLVARGLSMDPHSWWIGLLAETGVVGFVLYGAAFLLILYTVDRRSRGMERNMAMLAIGANAVLLSQGVAGLFEQSFMWSVNVWFSIGLALFFSYRPRPKIVEAVVMQQLTEREVCQPEV